MTGFGAAHLDRYLGGRATLNNEWNRWAIRGREQMMIDFNGGAQRQGGTSGNVINGIGWYNPMRSIYIDAALTMFGPLPDRSPGR